MYALCYYIYIYIHTHIAYIIHDLPRSQHQPRGLLGSEKGRQKMNELNQAKDKLAEAGRFSFSQQTMVDSTKHHYSRSPDGNGFWFHRARGLCAFLGFMWKNHLKNLYFLEMNYPLFSWVIWILDAFTPFESLVVQNEIFVGHVWQYVIFCLDIVLCLLNYII